MYNKILNIRDIMDKSLDKIFKTIDSIDADENIKNFYKNLLLFESKNNSPRYIDSYKKLIKVHTRDI